MGGKGHEFVVAVAGVLAGPQGIADHGVFINAHQAGGLADATAVLEVPEDGHGLLLRQSGAEQGGAFALGEALLASAAGEHAALGLAITEADAEVAPATQAIVGAVGILTAEQVKVFHEDYQQESRTGDSAS